MLYQKFAFQPCIKSASSFLYFQRKGITQRILHELKYKGKKELGYLMGSWFAPSIKCENIDIVIPVPLHKSKLRQRTYNQSEEIAKGIAEKQGLNLRADLIKREVATETQTKKSKAHRWMNMENVYSTSLEDLSGLSVMIVDDVITTGATVGMLCERLVEANVEEIHIATLARGK
ncbi:ComF family protein [Ekhidna sp. To15]|uniref:ComF family protein n=1 Tax=Ekhidna sp. To15 TaxID=3395267 RepID=UPI003F51C940